MLRVPRAYQSWLIDQTSQAWARGVKNVLIVLPTGGGKTFVFARIAASWSGAVCAIAHRRELVTQMSMAFAREGIRHRVIGPPEVGRTCAGLHQMELGRSFYDPGARHGVAGVDTLTRMSASDPWLTQVTLWIQDEAHHLLVDNKWGKASALFPRARGLGVTATPVRADGKGLGRHADGLIDEMIVGPSMRELISDGYLSDYRIIAPPSDIDLSKVTITASGDYSPPQLRDARRKSHLTGDVVKHYLRFAPGKLGITFDTDIDSAVETARSYRDAGVPAEVVTSDTAPYVRADVQRRFARREVLQLVNVDLFGEGYDLPALEVVSMARPTESFTLYAQQFGRALRVMKGKDRATIIDHASNVARHGVPDAVREWSLDRRDRRSRSTPLDTIPVRTCLNESCFAVYERTFPACPYCGHVFVIGDRSAPEFVDGDLTELDPAVLSILRGEKARVDGDAVVPHSATPEVRGAIIRRHWERQEAQRELRAAIALWAGWQRTIGRQDPESYKRFFFTFGVDVMTAQTFGARQANDLNARVQAELNSNGVIKEQQ